MQACRTKWTLQWGDAMKKTNQIARCALLIALALVLSYTERLIPLQMVIPLPGIKLGLANIVTLIALYLMGAKSALIILVLRCIRISVLLLVHLVLTFFFLDLQKIGLFLFLGALYIQLQRAEHRREKTQAQALRRLLQDHQHDACCIHHQNDDGQHEAKQGRGEHAVNFLYILIHDEHLS